MSLGAWLLDPSGLTPHGFCLSWQPGLIALHAGSDAVVGLSYFSIPLALAWFVRQRRDLGYRWVFHAFVAFILACGTTHLLAILTLWVPAYGIEGLVKLVTALLSVATAAILWPLIPRLVALPSPAQLREANAALSATIAEYERTALLLRETEGRVRATNSELELRVADRTAELRAMNATLTEALAERTRAQQAQARSEAQFRASFEAAAVGKVLVEPNSRRIIRVNPALAAMLGYEPDELAGRDGAVLLFPDDAPPNLDAYARLLSGESPTFIREARCMRRDGTPLWTRISNAVARDPQTGLPTLTVSIIEDIDARYRAEAELRALNTTLIETVGERDRALRSLALSEAEFRAGFDNAAIGIVLTEPESIRMVRVNRAFAHMLGYEPDELAGRLGPEVLVSEDRGPVLQARARLLSGESPDYVREARCVRRDGTPLWTRISSAIARDPQTGEPALRVSLVEDIDARYRAEADLRALNSTLTETVAERDRALRALARSEEEFRAGFNAAAVGIVLTEPDSRHIVRVNRAFAAMLGYQPDEMVGRNGGELLLPEDRVPTLATSERMLAGEFPSFIREARCIRRDGTPLWTRISSSIARDPSTGKPALTVAVVEDIDGRHRAETELLKANAHLTQALAERAGALQALEQSEAMFRASFEGAAVGKVLADPTTRCYVRVNRAFAHMLGHAPEHFVGRTVAEFTWHEDQPGDASGFALLMSGETETFVREKRLLRRDGQPFWARISSNVVTTADSLHPVLVVVVVEDIDAKHKAEAELRSAKHELELVVEQRTAALSQRDLLLREVYHRVKNNLQIIDGLLTMQARRLDDPQAKRALLGLRGRVYALGLVHQQLMGSADLKTFDVAPFLEVLSRNIVEGGAQGGVALLVDACPLQVGLDFALPLGLLVTELVSNSLKHAFPDGNGRISVLLQQEANGDVVLVVSDDGPTQSGDAAPALAKPGLGLSIVKGLVGQIGATMSVRHEHGTCTEIRTPMPAPS